VTRPVEARVFFRHSRRLEIDIGIDLVGDAVVALIAFESDIVRGGADPQGFAVDLERRFPDTQVIARPDDTDGSAWAQP